MIREEGQLAGQIKAKCVAYVRQYLMEDFWLSEEAQDLRMNYEETPQPASSTAVYESEWIDAMDWFILFGHTSQGERVLAQIRDKAGLSPREDLIIRDWYKYAFLSVFEIKQIKSDYLDLFDVVAEVDYKVFGNSTETFREFTKILRSGMFLRTRLVPVQGRWFLSGSQQVLPAHAEEFIFHNYVGPLTGHPDWYLNNPQKLTRAFALQKEHYEHFVKLFGSDEIVVPGHEVGNVEREFYNSWAQSHGHIEAFEPPQLPEEFLQAADVGLVVDEREGWHHFVDYGRFLSIFRDSLRLPGWQELVMGYLEDNEADQESFTTGVPAFVFRRMKDKYPEQFRLVLQDLLPAWTKKRDPVKSFDELMDEYKPGWQTVYPSIHPLNERFKDYYYRNPEVGRNDPCPCGSGKKYKRCHGR